MNETPRDAIHYSELGPIIASDPIAKEWDCYRREVGRLLAEGLEGKYALIKGEEIIGIWDWYADAYEAAKQQYPDQPVLIQKILTCTPLYRTPLAYAGVPDPAGNHPYPPGSPINPDNPPAWLVDLLMDMDRETLMRSRAKNPERKLSPRNTIHYSELPPSVPNTPLAEEWDFYRREVGRLLAEGLEGKYVLIKGEAIIGLWDTAGEARAVALQKFLRQPVLIHQIQTREPLLRTPLSYCRCHS